MTPTPHGARLAAVRADAGGIIDEVHLNPDGARRLVRAVGRQASRARHVILPEGSSPRRKAAAGVLAGAVMVLGAVATTTVTALLGTTTIL